MCVWVCLCVYLDAIRFSLLKSMTDPLFGYQGLWVCVEVLERVARLQYESFRTQGDDKSIINE